MLGIDNQIFCQNCDCQYKDNNLPRILTTCGHTYCETCIINIFREIKEENQQYFEVECPEDGTKICLAVKDIMMFPKNLALIKVLQAKKNNSSFKDESFNLSKIVKQQEAQQDDLTDQLITAMTECHDVEEKAIEKGNTEKTDQIPSKNQIPITQKVQKIKDLDEVCLLHQKPLQIICLNDQQKICAKCAIFGQHKGHSFKSIQQVQIQKTACYMDLLKIFAQKQQIFAKMSNQQTSKGLIQILMNKKGTLSGQIRDEFRRLRQEITKQQRRVLKKLDEVYRTTQTKIKTLLKFDQSIEKTFSCWQSQSFSTLKILQSYDFDSIVKVLYSKDQVSQILLNQGSNILKDMKSYENQILSRVEGLLGDLKVNKSTEIFTALDSFINFVVPTIKQIQKQSKRSLSTVLEQQSNTSFFEELKYTSKSPQGSPLLEQSLLDVEDNKQATINVQAFSSQSFDMPLSCDLLQNKGKLVNQIAKEESLSCNFINLELQSTRKLPLREAFTRRNCENAQNDEFFEGSRKSLLFTSRPSLSSQIQNSDKPNKKKLKSIKISEKYEKVLEGIFNNTLDTIDLTNCEAGDLILAQICEFVKYSKARNIKFIRTKLTDSGIEKILPTLGNVQILNLSQNNLTENVLDIFIKHRYGYLSGLKNLILNQNKIIERKHKAKIDQLRSMSLTVSI